MAKEQMEISSFVLWVEHVWTFAYSQWKYNEPESTTSNDPRRTRLQVTGPCKDQFRAPVCVISNARLRSWQNFLKWEKKLGNFLVNLDGLLRSRQMMLRKFLEVRPVLWNLRSNETGKAYPHNKMNTYVVVYLKGVFFCWCDKKNARGQPGLVAWPITLLKEKEKGELGRTGSEKNKIELKAKKISRSAKRKEAQKVREKARMNVKTNNNREAHKNEKKILKFRRYLVLHSFRYAQSSKLQRDTYYYLFTMICSYLQKVEQICLSTLLSQTESWRNVSGAWLVDIAKMNQDRPSPTNQASVKFLRDSVSYQWHKKAVIWRYFKMTFVAPLHTSCNDWGSRRDVRVMVGVGSNNKTRTFFFACPPPNMKCVNYTFWAIIATYWYI